MRGMDLQQLEAGSQRAPGGVDEVVDDLGRSPASSSASRQRVVVRRRGIADGASGVQPPCSGARPPAAVPRRRATGLAAGVRELDAGHRALRR